MHGNFMIQPQMSQCHFCTLLAKTITKLTPGSREEDIDPHLLMGEDLQSHCKKSTWVEAIVVAIFEKHNIPRALLLRKQHFPRNHRQIYSCISLTHLCHIHAQLLGRVRKGVFDLQVCLVGGGLGEGGRMTVSYAVSKVCHTPLPTARLNLSLLCGRRILASIQYL